MRILHRAVWWWALAVAAPATLLGQGEDVAAPRQPWIQIKLSSLGLRAGVDLEDGGQALVGGTVGIGRVFTDRLRFRLGGELGFSPGPNSYVGNLEILFRFTPDSAVAVPYVGTGVGLAGNEECGSVPGCPGIWWQFVIGFELALTRQFNWLIEYHPQDAFSRQRVLVGLVTRIGEF